MHSFSTRYRRPPGLEGVEVLRLADPDFHFAPHTHDAYVFWINGTGGERVSFGGSSAILQPDSFGVVAPGEVHANRPVTESRTLESFYVDPIVIEEIVGQCGGRSSGFRSRLQRDTEARGWLADLHAVLIRSEDAFLIHESFLSVFSRLLGRHGEYRLYPRPGSEPRKVAEARSILDERFAESLGLDEVAALCGCSACHLIRLFRRETGMSPHAYLVERRLACAKALLAEGASLVEVALDTGFADQSHLARRFKLRFGITPGRYRRQVCS
ncbi:AraC family transcriptional regulator [Pseudodesulfovibrio cashew]|nr:AraC family transcriptional regulator [Pseudodesulfovibrio cashew]